MAIEVREGLGLEFVALLPAPRPRLRGEPSASAEQRLALLRAAVDGIQGLAVDARELGHEGPTRTVDTLESIRKEPGLSLAQASVAFVMGMDAFSRFGQWHNHARIMALCHLVLIRRPGIPLPRDGVPGELLAAVKTDDPAVVKTQPAGRIIMLSVPDMDVSATLVRERIRTGRSIQFLVPDKVRDMIETQGIYTNAK
jgi:nicotinate-nucleotide adenylyltransferase